MTRPWNPKAFYRSVEALFRTLEGTRGARAFREHLAASVLEHLGEALDIEGVQFYRPRGQRLSLVHQAGRTASDLAPELTLRLRPGTAVPTTELPWLGTTAQGDIGVVALPGEGRELLVLRFRGGPEERDRGERLAPLSALQHTLSQHVHRRVLEDLIEQARAIQMSLLPSAPPAFGDFDIGAASLPARVVGGDLFDFIPLDADTLAVAVADASGHGLPAALQARDVAVGLRMGIEKDLKIARMVEKLNRVIHRSGLASRFVSLVFAELEINGNLFYINAGHPPPLLRDDRGLHELGVGGMILGPRPDASYKLGFTHVDRGAALAFYTDGVIECGLPHRRPFGLEGLTAWLTDWREGAAQAAVEDLLARLKTHAGEPAFEDDLTIVYIRRPREDASADGRGPSA